MALVDNGVKVSVSQNLIPSNATDQVVTVFTDFEYTRNLTLDIPKATVENADKGVTFDNIIDDVAVGIKKQVADIMGADYDDVANTVTYYTDYKSISSNFLVNLSSEFYSNAAINYTCSVTVYIKTT